MKKRLMLYGILLTILIAGCRDMYDIPNEVKNLNLLVIEGFLNSNGPTSIKLSRTVNLRDTAQIKPEINAIVKVEGENSTSYTLTGNAKGEYNYPFLPLIDNIKYRLRIKTATGKEYLSDFVPVQKSPAIDSVNWQRKESGLETGIQIYVNTHDPQNQTKYYRWEYDETWEFHSPFSSSFEYRNDSMLPRTDPIKIFICWKSESSTSVLLGSSAKLSQDVISLAPITVIPSGSIKITVRYSILIKQYALTKEAYNYWEILKKNTEQVGTLFDPQPSHLFANIHCVTSPDEEVLGYISAGSTSEKRLFITRNEVEPWNYFHGCITDTIANKPAFLKAAFGSKILVPTEAIYGPFGSIAAYVGAIEPCVDCTTIGTNVKPSFW